MQLHKKVIFEALSGEIHLECSRRRHSGSNHSDSSPVGIVVDSSAGGGDAMSGGGAAFFVEGRGVVARFLLTAPPRLARRLAPPFFARRLPAFFFPFFLATRPAEPLRGLFAALVVFFAAMNVPPV